MAVSVEREGAGASRSPVVDALGRAWYRAARFLVALVLLTVFRLEVEGRENVPGRGPVILASNHSSLLDPPVVGVGCPRRVHFMAKEELFSSRPLGALLGSLGGFPVARGTADRGALRTARRLLDGGEVLGIFPEGKRGRGSLGEGEAGTAWLSVVTGSPVVPVAVIGTAGVLEDIISGILPHLPLPPAGGKVGMGGSGGGPRWGAFRPKRITVRFGSPILPEDTEAGECPGDGRPAATGSYRRRERMTLAVMRGISELVGREETQGGETLG
ncbi:MAG: 1-acyl-sn-glycerol-3-phosphate acyltransferase [Actinobacteria bacterium]|nr:1-acyl-sn-glycerol-3-phosphate acyltransferase [Actinomycetota bacterium]